MELPCASPYDSTIFEQIGRLVNETAPKKLRKTPFLSFDLFYFFSDQVCSWLRITGLAVIQNQYPSVSSCSNFRVKQSQFDMLWLRLRRNIQYSSRGTPKEMKRAASGYNRTGTSRIWPMQRNYSLRNMTTILSTWSLIRENCGPKSRFGDSKL